MRSPKVEFRPVGGGIGCLLMIVISLLLSALCTLAVNVVGR
jgi:hypothetical protein